MASASGSSKKQLGVEFPMLPRARSSAAYDDTHGYGGGGLVIGGLVRYFASHDNTFNYYVNGLGAVLEVAAAGLHTVCDVQGAGVLTHVIGLANVSGSSADYNNNPTRIEVTVDGRKYVVDYADKFKDRKIIGAVKFNISDGYGPSMSMGHNPNKLSHWMLKDDRLNLGVDGVPFVRFEKSLKVEVYRMDMPVAPARNENWCGAIFRLDSDITKGAV